MSKQYVFNITLHEKDADVKRDASINNDSLSSIASSMSSDNMSKFAEKYLNTKQNQWGFNFTLLKYWRKHASRNAKQVILALPILLVHVSIEDVNDFCDYSYQSIILRSDNEMLHILQLLRSQGKINKR